MGRHRDKRAIGARAAYASTKQAPFVLQANHAPSKRAAETIEVTRGQDGAAQLAESLFPAVIRVTDCRRPPARMLSKAEKAAAKLRGRTSFESPAGLAPQNVMARLRAWYKRDPMGAPSFEEWLQTAREVQAGVWPELDSAE